MINHKNIQEFRGLEETQGGDFVLLLHQQVSGVAGEDTSLSVSSAGGSGGGVGWGEDEVRVGVVLPWLVSNLS